MKANARSYSNQYVRRGLLKRQPCEVCGTTDQVEKHHGDYSKPLQVRWLCRRHHRAIERILGKVATVPHLVEEMITGAIIVVRDGLRLDPVSVSALLRLARDQKVAVNGAA